MSATHIQPVPQGATAIDTYQEGGDVGPREPFGDAAPAEKALPIARYLNAIRRFKWLILLLAIAGAGVGYVATRFIEAEYEASANVLLEQGGNTFGGGNGPIQANALLEGAAAWEDLLRSYRIADAVVTQLGLYVTPADKADSAVFRGFALDASKRLLPGKYKLVTTGQRYTLALNPGPEVERGVLGDSIGRPVGFAWQPDRRALTSAGGEIEFEVRTIRETSTDVLGRLSYTIKKGSNFMFVRYRDSDAGRAAATLNTWIEEFVAVATELKKKNIASVALILDGQREYAAENLSSAEAALQSFRVSTVTEPNEQQVIAPGIEMTNNPVYASFFRDQLTADAYKRDREALEGIFERGRRTGTWTREAVLAVPIVNSDPAAENLRLLLAEQMQRESNIRRLRESYTDDFPAVKNELAALTTLRTSAVPGALEAFIAQLRTREQEVVASVERGSRALRSIPPRTIMEQKLKRQLEVADQLYKTLNLQAAQARLAEAATVPDLSVLATATPPKSPTRNTAPVIVLAATGAALGFGLLLAILADQMDRRFRYPEQATQDMGLFILGVVPVVSVEGRRRAADQAAQVVEAFRTVRMNVRYAADPRRPLTLTITSPGPNDGKSLMASNLALSFAEAGARTLLIDGDIRRGALAATFDVPARPGLVEYLDGTSLIAEVLHPTTSHQNLTVMAAGARRRRAPELLATPRLTQLISQMSEEFDVVIVDSPPLGAGFDAYALATATVNMALVLRAGVTDRKMAAAKLKVLDTLPVRVLGAVLNGIKLTGEYQYYSYYTEYQPMDQGPVRSLESGNRGGSSSDEVLQVGGG